MPTVQRWLFPALWLAWAVYWWRQSHGVKAAERSEPALSRALHIGPLLLAAALLWVDRLPVAGLDHRLLPWAPWQFWGGAALVAAGLGFTVWARVHLGRNWSGVVTLKQGHELVASGPYALVRHPIYSGLLLAFAGSALARGEWRGVLAVLIVGAALWRKLRLEERWMRERFGAQYDDYCRRVPALLPWPR